MTTEPTPAPDLSTLIASLDTMTTNSHVYITDFLGFWLADNQPNEPAGELEGELVTYPSVARLIVERYGSLQIYAEAEDKALMISKINDGRASLRGHLKGCEQMATEARRILKELIRDLCDYEFADGLQGEDIEEILNKTSTNMRYALALFDQVALRN